MNAIQFFFFFLFSFCTNHTSLTCHGTVHYNPDVCSGHGFCLMEDRCICYEGYTGYQCQKEINCHDIKKSDKNVCSGHGECTEYGICKCNEAYRGLECGSVVECDGFLKTDPNVCSGHGMLFVRCALLIWTPK